MPWQQWCTCYNIFLYSTTVEWFWAPHSHFLATFEVNSTVKLKHLPVPSYYDFKTCDKKFWQDSKVCLAPKKSSDIDDFLQYGLNYLAYKVKDFNQTDAYSFTTCRPLEFQQISTCQSGYGQQRPPTYRQPQNQYGAPPGEYGAPQGQGGYGAPPGQSYGAPQGQGYGALQGQGYWVPQDQKYGAPPPGQNYGALQGQGYGAPPGQGYGSPPSISPELWTWFQSSLLNIPQTSDTGDSKMIKISEQDPVNRKSRDQGRHECQVLERGSEIKESGYAWDTCTKNPGHESFIPAPKFCLDDLPEECRYQSIVDFVKTIMALTVRLRVEYTSWKRPRGYSFYKDRGSDILHTGSGWVCQVIAGEGACQCSQCVQSASPFQKWYVICVRTACHVVYNKEEACHTKIDFFYEDERSRVTGRMKTHRGLGVIDTDKEHETCCIYLITHDEVLASELKNYVQLVKNYKFEDFISEPTKDKYICIAVSHPHGQPKHVTIGERKLLPGQKRDDATSYCYSTDTCEGSSGAPVVAFLSKSPFLLQFWAPHSEYLEEYKVNKSGRVSSFKISPTPIEVIQAQMIGQIGKEHLTLHEADIEEYDGPLLYGQYSLHILQIQALLDSQIVSPSDENDKTIQEQVRLMREVACVDYVNSLDQRKDFLWLYILCLELLLVCWIFCDWVTGQNETWKQNDIYG